MKILMCKPTYFEVRYKINPWMRIGASVQDKAIAQWQRLLELVKSCGAVVELIDPVPGLPDMVFTANCGMYIGDRILLSHFKYTERQGERKYFQEWFATHDIEILFDEDNQLSFEGAGDGLMLGDKTFVGYGFRTDKAYLAKLIKFGVNNLVACELVDPHFYHIDTCFCPLDRDTALWWPGAFSQESQQRMQARANLIAVPKEEADRFACNAVVINKQVILPDNCTKTMALLERHGFQTLSCDMSEFLKSGGACKCLTFELR